MHDQLERVLQLPQGHLARLADQQRREHRLKKPFEKQDKTVCEVAILTAERLSCRCRLRVGNNDRGEDDRSKEDNECPVHHSW